MTAMQFLYDDGGRASAGFRGTAGDCVVRAVAIATGQPYTVVYAALSAGARAQRKTRRSRQRASARDGVNVRRKWFRDYMAGLGWHWTPTMGIGTGCRIHLYGGELPAGRLVVSLSRHYTAVVDGVIHDTHDPQRETHCVEPDHGQPLRVGQWRNSNGVCSIARRCVYGYWSKDTQQGG